LSANFHSGKFSAGADGVGTTWNQGSNFIAAIAAIAVEGEQNAVDHCGNDGNFLPYSAIFILFTVHYYFDT
jgi:hypothetical protein